MCFQSIKPKALAEMNKRANERKQKRLELQLLKEKKYNEMKEKEKEMKTREKEEEALKKQQENETIAREKAKKIAKQMLLRQQQALSDMHYKRSLIIYHAWIPWMKRLELIKMKRFKAVQFNNKLLQTQTWRWNFLRHKIYKSCAKECSALCLDVMSQHFCNKVLRKRFFFIWGELCDVGKTKTEINLRHHKTSQTKFVWFQWKKCYEMKQTEKAWQERKKDEKAAEFSTQKLTKKIMHEWMQSAAASKREKIKLEKWNKVHRWLSTMRSNVDVPN
ncbi:DNA ligase I [Reticulomyxa filosa]|uniref:DNA ligase I n=1 Tax=Reticulomyxa filosa TaxID=46433 RepID=X6LUC5_RETFI|nr:DNA ligase I [Reticulomyxa filosa]|eukprot:ETO05234.1 DNA ligase I [Reticulomyxa filosa]